MNIAIIGWGSLIHNHAHLKILPVNDNLWHYDGPLLPIEFKRISKDGRLSMVIAPGEEKIKTFFAITTYPSIQQAISALTARESCHEYHIGSYICQTDSFAPDHFLFKQEIREWCQMHKDIDAVLWTNLPEKLTQIKCEPSLVNDDDIIFYLNTLPPHIKEKAKNYIQNVPREIETALRKKVRRKLKWEYTRLEKLQIIDENTSHKHQPSWWRLHWNLPPSFSFNKKRH